MTHPDLSCATWRKSTRSNGHGACVEVAHVHPAVAIRDSKNTAGPALAVRSGSWSEFVGQVRIGYSPG
jgi:hypothetical protein